MCIKHQCSRCGSSLFLALVQSLFLASFCSAAVTGGYMVSSSSELMYLRLTQSGTALDGDLNLVDANNSSQGFTATRYNVTGTIVQRHVELRVDGFIGIRSPLLDGDIEGERLSLNYPRDDGRFTKSVLHRATASTWNGAVIVFETRQIRIAYLRSQIGIYNDSREQYNAARTDLPYANAAYQVAVSNQTRMQAVVDLAQLNLSKAQDQDDAAKKLSDQLKANWNDKLEDNAYQQQEENHLKADEAESNADDTVFRSKSDLYDAQSDLRNATQSVSDAENRVTTDSNTANTAYSSALQAAKQVPLVTILLQAKNHSVKHVHQPRK